MGIKKSDVVEKFFLMENDLNLYSYSILGVGFWELIRWRLLNKITSIDSIVENNKDKQSFFRRVINKYRFKNILSSINYHKTNNDCIIFEHSRNNIYNDEYIDIYSKFYQDEVLINKNITNITTNNKKLDSNSKAMYDILFDDLFYFYYRNKVNKEICKLSEIILELNKRIEIDFSIKMNCSKLIINRISMFLSKKRLYLKFFNRNKIKKIYLTVSYENQALISSTKDLGITSIEFQHGVIDYYNIAYNFSNNKPQYFPDKVIMFNNFWYEKSYFPLNIQDVEYFGNRMITENLMKYTLSLKRKNSVVFLSQWNHSSEIFKYAKNLAIELPDYNIVFRSHPYTSNNTIEKYRQVSSSIQNFRMSSYKNEELLHLLSITEFQIGVYSTSIYEGLAFGCKTIILNSFGYEHCEKLIVKEWAKLVSSGTELKKEIISGIDTINIPRLLF